MSEIISDRPHTAVTPKTESQSSLGMGDPQLFVHEADDMSFESEVIERSLRVPVLLDCWAEWCGPCQALGPTLERLASQYKGRFELVKVDIDKAQRVAMALRIQSVPFMVLFIDGRPVDALVGNQSETSVRAFLDRHIPPDDTDPYERGIEALNAGDYPTALAALQQALLESPDRGEIRVAMGRAALSMGDLDSAQQLLKSVPSEDVHYPRAQDLMKLFALVEFRGDEGELQLRLERDQRDVDAWYRCGVNQAFRGEFELACESLLRVVSLDRSYRDDAGRHTLLLLFEVLGLEHPLVGKSRKTLASYLF